MNYRESRNYLNLEKRMFDGDGEYRIPRLMPTDVQVAGDEFIGFNYALTTKNPQDKIVHFYLDDYQFARVWDSPDRYVPILKRFKAVHTPDFSMYTDFPKAVQIYNFYRSMWCGAYWQEHGLNVIPTVKWSDEDSLSWCFDGMPRRAVVSVSTIGCMKQGIPKQLFLTGWEAMMDYLNPSKILLFGNSFPDVRSNCEIVRIRDRATQKRRQDCEGRDENAGKRR